MDISLLDLLYDNLDISSVAVTSRDGMILENQLDIPDPSLKKIAIRVAELKMSLSQSQRMLRGFVIKTEEAAIQACLFDSFFIFVKMDNEFSAQLIEKNVRSIFDNEEYLPHTTPVKGEPAEAGLSLDAISVSDESLDGYVSLKQYVAQLTNFLCQVENLQYVNENIANAVSEMAYAEGIKKITANDAIIIGKKAIKNSSSNRNRKILDKEFKVISDWMSY